MIDDETGPDGRACVREVDEGEEVEVEVEVAVGFSKLREVFRRRHRSQAR
jgi:hypothetical protein